jgi:heptosyltransferase-3
MNQPQNKNILIYRIGSLGDTVVALPCFRLIARKYPNSRRTLLTNIPVHVKAPAAIAVLGESGLIHDYLTYSIGTRNASHLAKLWWQIRRLKIDTVIYLAPPRGEAVARRDEKFFRLCGVKEIIGLPIGDLASHRFDSVTKRYEPETNRLARCLSAIGDACPGDPMNWDLGLTRGETARAEVELASLNGRSFFVLCVATKRSVSDWGLENWKSLMARLSSDSDLTDHGAVFIGATEDRSISDEVAMQWPGMTLNLCGALSPRESAALIRQASFFLGLDSGPMHLAASVGTACVSIFAGNNRPGIWFPTGGSHELIYHQTECGGCGLDVCIVEKKKCILSITVEEVAAAVLRVKLRNAERETTRV